jgi:hypothetical protein
VPSRKRFEMRVPASFLKMVDDWRRRQPELPFRGHPPFGRARAEGEAQKDIGSMARKLKLLAGLSPKIAACLNSQSIEVA